MIICFRRKWIPQSQELMLRAKEKNSLSLMIIMDLFADSLELLHKYIFEGITPIN